MTGPAEATTVKLHEGSTLQSRLSRLECYLLQRGVVPLSRHPAWLMVLRDGLQHVPYCLEAVQGDKTVGFLPLAFVRSMLFGKYLVSLPYLNYGGVLANDPADACLLVDEAVKLANQLDVRYLELRQETKLDHPALLHSVCSKVHMRLPLPSTCDVLWKQLPSKVRNQVRKGQKSGLDVAWGSQELLAEFFAVFSHNMRDLGTPTYGKSLFASIIGQFPDRAEICVVRTANKPIAAALLLHGWGVTEVPSASSLRQFNHTCSNMLLYWHLLERAVQRQQGTFDFGRSSPNSTSCRFKEQWGAQPSPAVWQYFARHGTIGDMRPENPRFQALIRVWQSLPLGLTRWIGPRIIRGIP